MGGRRYTRKWKSEFRERTGHSAQKPSPWTIERVGERWVGYSTVTNLLIVRRKSRRLVDCPRFQLWIPEVLFTSWPLTVRSSRQEWVPTHLLSPALPGLDRSYTCPQPRRTSRLCPIIHRHYARGRGPRWPARRKIQILIFWNRYISICWFLDFKILCESLGL